MGSKMIPFPWSLLYPKQSLKTFPDIIPIFPPPIPRPEGKKMDEG